MNHTASDCDVDSNPDDLQENRSESTSQQEEVESWADWIKRVTRQIGEQPHRLNIQSWVFRARAAKWNWAQRVASHGTDRWAHKVLSWDPMYFCDGPHSQAHRPPGRPKLRWVDEIIQYTHICHDIAQWNDLTANAHAWFDLTDKLCQGSWRNLLHADTETDVDASMHPNLHE